MAYTYNKLRGRIVEKYGSQSKFAEVFGVSRATFSHKMNGSVGFSQDDIEKCAKLLDIPRSEYDEYFFA